jgi:hypothetical protein
MRFGNYAAVSLAFLLFTACLPGCVYSPGEIPGVSFLPIVQTFEASPAIIRAGEYSTLSWSVTGASKVYIDNNIGNVALRGNTPVSPGVTTFYTITASNSSGSTTARAQVIVTGSTAQQQAKQPVILSFSSDRNYTNPGETVTLYWNTAEASAVSLEPGGMVSPQGSKTVFPYTTSEYTLTASNSYGIVKNKLTIRVGANISYQSGQEKLIVLSALHQESGSLVKNNAVYTLQDSACAGDTSLNLASRAFLSFDITGIPANATINEAILDLSSYNQAGSPTYTVSMWGNMGAIEVYFYQYGGLSDLDIMAYNRQGRLISGGNITSYPQSPWQLDVKSSDTGEQVLQNLVQSGQSRCQFRVQFFTSTNWDGKADMLCFDDAKMIIKYTVP